MLGCAGEPSYEGRLCDIDRPCPDRYECGSDGMCHLQGSLQPDAQVELDGGDASFEDAAPLDASPDAGGEDVPPVDAGPMPTALEIRPDALSLAAGFTAQLTALASYSDLTMRDVTTEVVWAVDPMIAEIDTTGFLTTRAPGTTLIEATLDGIEGSAALNVTPAVILQVETWNKHNLVVKSDGTVWGWGWNEFRQLDPVAQNQITSPVKLAIEDVAWVRAGGTMTFAVKKDGTVWSWGGNSVGQLGNGNVGPDFVETPALIAGLSGVRDIRGGYNFALALMDNGTVMSWGGNSFGSLGHGGMTNPPVAVPTPIEPLTGIIAIAAGTYHGVALHADGTVDAWGYNEYGQLGSGAFAVHTNLPAPVEGLGSFGVVVAIDAGWGHTLALTTDGRALAWGWNGNGQLGDTTTMNRIAPDFVQNQGGGALTGVAQISAGFTHSYALLVDGTLTSWGNNLFGALGSGDMVERRFAAPVLESLGGPAFAGTATVSGGGDHGIVLTTPNQVFVFGSNANGELADGMFGMGLLVTAPQPVNGL